MGAQEVDNSPLDRLLLRLDEATASPRAPRIGWSVMGLAALAYAALVVFLSKDAAFTYDDLTWLVESDGFAPRGLLEPHYGHLAAITRFSYSAMLATVGPHEIVIRLFLVVANAAAALLLYALARRRIGPVAALAPGLLLLYLGATPETLLPSFASFGQAAAFGLGALLLLDRDGRRAGPPACLLLVLSVLSLEIGLAFAAAAAVLILAREDRLRRLWIVAVPFLVFAVWWLWARQFDESLASSSNLLLIPAYTADSAAAATSALAGLAHTFGPQEGSPLALEWGRMIAPVLLAAVIWRAARHGVTAWLVAFAVLAVTLWSGFALGYGPLRTPDVDRYAYPVALAILLILVEAFRGTPRGRVAVLLLAGVVLFSLPANLDRMRTNSRADDANSLTVRAEQTAIEIARDDIDPDFNGDLGLPDLTKASEYLAIVDEYRSLALSEAELEAEAGWVRDVTDAILLRAYQPRLVAAGRAGAGRPCGVATNSRAVPLAAGGGLLSGGGGAQVSIRRFGETWAPLEGRVRGSGSLLALPADRSDRPWELRSETSGAVVRVCPLAGGGS